MDSMLLSDSDILENFNGDFDMLLADESNEPKQSLDEMFLDSLIENDNISDWPEVFPQLSVLRNLDDEIGIKQEVLSPADSPQSTSYSDSGSSSSDEKYILETPPVSPPRDETSHFTIKLPPQPDPQQKKSTILKINPQNIKIIRNIKGLKPVGKQTQIVLPKDVLQKVMKCKPENGTLLNSPAPAKHSIRVTTPLILPSNQLKPVTVPIVPAETPAIKLEPISTHVVSSPFLRRESTDTSLKNDFNLKALKRQQRMIKNRESASLSRKKKKEYVTALENRLNHLEVENSQLKAENGRLKVRVKELEANGSYSEITRPSKLLSTSLKRTSALLAVLLMVSLNIGSLSLLSRENLSGETSNAVIASEPTGKHGRALLWAQPEVQETAENNTSSMDKSICPLHINQTESLRLEKELRRWISENKFQNSTKKPKDYKAEAKLFSSIYPPYRMKSTKKSRLKSGSSALDLYRPPFPGSLPRRDDTFYVFSFSSDHLLVPAVAHDKTLRPKMSFLIPANPLNDSVLVNGSVPMMQVDCEVLATKSVELTEEDFRAFRPTQEASNKNSSTSNVNFKDMNYRPYFLGDRKPSEKYEKKFDGYLKHVYQTVNSFP